MKLLALAFLLCCLHLGQGAAVCNIFGLSLVFYFRFPVNLQMKFFNSPKLPRKSKLSLQWSRKSKSLPQWSQKSKSSLQWSRKSKLQSKYFYIKKYLICITVIKVFNKILIKFQHTRTRDYSTNETRDNHG
jgi:hypothetical protein